ncbi:MAG: hypothetical protein IPL79_08410 [Myxococcales bacterium]|nr:hypothetical protein [Myxococcales bacterium]
MTAIRRALLACVVSAASAAWVGCAGTPGPAVAAPATVEPDDRFVVGGRSWYLIGNALTEGHDELDVTVWVPAGTKFVDAWLDDAPGVRLTYAEGVYVLRGSLAALGVDATPGAHRLRLAADGRGVAFADVTLHRSHPLYALLATDWDFSDPGDGTLAAQDTLRAENPALKITHFVGPYTFTDPELAPERVATLTAWLAAQAALGDEVALHIHPYCHFVTHAGLTCITDQSTVYAGGDTTGYTINVAAYDQASFATLLDAADQLFEDAGLGKPTSFRAGGWTAGAETIAALASRGYVVDSSALNWARMEEWDGVLNGELYRWNEEHWGPIDDVSQPYYPSAADPALATAPTLDILEVPDNAIMVDYVSVTEMVDILQANWPGEALTTPKTFVFGFHPATTSGPGSTDISRLRGIVAELGAHLAADGSGPIVYETMSALATLSW